MSDEMKLDDQMLEEIRSGLCCPNELDLIVGPVRTGRAQVLDYSPEAFRQSDALSKVLNPNTEQK